jgi:hypothetical protein
MQQSRSIFSLSVPVAPGAVAFARGVDFAGAQIAAAGAKGMGIARRAAASGGSYEADVIGTAICEAGAAITAGQPLAFDSVGRVVPASSLVAAAPGLGTLAVAAGGTAVTSAAANGTGSISGAPTAGTLTGGILPQWIVGDAMADASGAGVFIEVLLAR